MLKTIEMKKRKKKALRGARFIVDAVPIFSRSLISSCEVEVDGDGRKHGKRRDFAQRAGPTRCEGLEAFYSPGSGTCIARAPDVPLSSVFSRKFVITKDNPTRPDPQPKTQTKPQKPPWPASAVSSPSPRPPNPEPPSPPLLHLRPLPPPPSALAVSFLLLRRRPQPGLSSNAANVLYFKSGYNVQVIVDEDEPEEVLLRRFRREVAKAGVIQECRRRRFFENTQEEKKRKKKEAARRNRRR
ncbi:uncharacterized protein A4U43_C01F1560 [Asparagus officinalis]|uniref:30S ribosomal protein S21, chloroplastic n=1 Tax=Asparagus officinalis TaxID=4686 RepID=A0A5P1FLF7_ASPOF|nr:uncharacterized protein A4U43_C01F1560 [Asparagus officinalis]